MAEKIERTYIVAKESGKTAGIIDMIVMFDDLPNHQPLQDRYNALLYVATHIEYDVLKKRHPNAKIVYSNDSLLSLSEVQYIKRKKPKEISANKMLLDMGAKLKRFEKAKI